MINIIFIFFFLCELNKNMANSVNLYSCGGSLLNAGQQTMVNSIPCVLSSDHTNLNVNVISSSTNPTVFQMYSNLSGVALVGIDTIYPTGGILSASKPPFLPSTHENIRLTSTSASDSGKLYNVEGFDDNGVIKKEIITCNGTTPVNSVNNYACVTNFYATNNNVGNIFLTDQNSTITAGSPNRAIAVIPIGANIGRAYINWFCVPAGKSLKILRALFTVSNNVNQHRATLRQSDINNNIGSTTNSLVRQYGLNSTGFCQFSYSPDGLIINNTTSGKNYFWFEANFLGADLSARMTIDLQFTLI